MTAPLRLLVVVPTLDAGGGAEVHVSKLVPGLARRGYRVEVATFGERREPWLELPSTIRVTPLTARPAGGTPRHALRAASALKRRLEANPPDVVLAVLEAASLTALGAARGAVPVVASVQNTLSRNYSDANPVSRAAILALCRRRLPRAAAIVATSRGVAADLRTVVPRAGEVVVIHNAVFDPAQPPPVAADRGEGFLLVACGRLIVQKGFPDLLAALARTRHRTTRLVVLGEGPDRGELERRAAALGVEDRVDWLGFRDDPRPWMAAADLFVLSSHWEGFGNVLVEAMACGTPVVTTDCPHGPAEIVRDGVDGTVVPVADPEAMAAAIDDLLGDEDRRRRFAASARERAGAFSIDASVEAHDELLRRVAGR